MSYIITFALGLTAGFIGGLLVFRKNREKIDQAEAKARSIAEQFKN
jgi:hypothetical protein